MMDRDIQAPWIGNPDYGIRYEEDDYDYDEDFAYETARDMEMEYGE